jgi:hypothetical protein
MFTRSLSTRIKRLVFNRHAELFGVAACSKCWIGDELEYHHIIAVNDMGDDSLSNFILLCHRCHKQWHLEGDMKIDFWEWLKIPHTEVANQVYSLAAEYNKNAPIIMVKEGIEKYQRERTEKIRKMTEKGS